MKRQKIRKSLLFLSFLLFQIRIVHLFLSPVLIIVGTSQGIITGSFAIFILLFLSSLYFGRAFCAWLCPGAAMQEFCSTFIHKKATGGKYNRIKYVIWSLWIGVIVYSAVRAGGYRSLDLFYGIGPGSTAQKYIIFFGAAVLIVPTTWLWGKWALCHYSCFIAPFLVIGTQMKDWGKWPSLHLQIKEDTCTQCELCDQHCPMSLNVSEMVTAGSMKNSECILCGNCVDGCPTGIIQYSFSNPS